MTNLDYETAQLKEKVNLHDLQTLVGKELKSGSKTEEELLSSFPNAKYDELIKVLKNMLFLKLITKEGYPVKYTLSKEITNKLTDLKKLAENDKNTLRASILIESKSNDKGELRTSMEQIADALKKDENYYIYTLEIADIVIHDNLFSTFISCELSCISINSLFRLIYFYGATSLEVIKPDKLTVGISDIQQTTQTIIDMTHGYAEIIYHLKKQNAELSKLR